MLGHGIFFKLMDVSQHDTLMDVCDTRVTG